MALRSHVLHARNDDDDAMHKRGVRPSIRLSVCLSHMCILSKPANVFAIFFRRRWFYFKRYGNIPTGFPNEGVECMWVGKNCYFRPIYRFIACCQQCDRRVLSKVAPGAVTSL